MMHSLIGLGILLVIGLFIYFWDREETKRGNSAKDGRTCGPVSYIDAPVKKDYKHSPRYRLRKLRLKGGRFQRFGSSRHYL